MEYLTNRQPEVSDGANIASGVVIVDHNLPHSKPPRTEYEACCLAVALELGCSVLT
jgi:hypothetical protein